jgi:DNA-binding NtrC family response regulator
MLRQLGVLVVCGASETRRSLIRMLESLMDGTSADVISCSTLHQAREVLRSREVALIFCHETLPDGSYRDLLGLGSKWRKVPQIVVMLAIGEWPEYLEALRLGAFEALRCPLHSTDVELAVIRALRSEQNAYQQQAVYPMAG